MKLREFDSKKRFRITRNKKQRRRFYDKSGRRCWYCGKGLKKKLFILEHQTPFARGGSCKLKENIVLACNECDKSKGGKTVEQFRKSLAIRLDMEIAFYGESGRIIKQLLIENVTKCGASLAETAT